MLYWNSDWIGTWKTYQPAFRGVMFYNILYDAPVATILWLTDDVFVAAHDHDDDDGPFLNLVPVARRFGFSCSMGICVVCVFVRHGVNPVPACSALVDWRCNAEEDGDVFMTSYITDTNDHDPVALLVTAEALVRLFGSSNVRDVEFISYEFNEEQSWALATAATLDCLMLNYCAVPDQFWEALHLNRSPRELNLGSGLMNSSVFEKSLLAAALRVNTSVERLSYVLEDGTTDPQVELIESFAYNRGIVDLRLYWRRVHNDTWSRLSWALGRNETIASLVLGGGDLDRAVHTRVYADVLERNSSIQEITLPEWNRDEDLYRNLVVPRLELNQFRPHVRAVQWAPDDERESMFLDAYVEAGDDLSKVYLLLRENTDFMVEMINV